MMTDTPARLRIAYLINSMEGGGAALPVPAILGVARDAGAEVRLFALTRADGRAIAPLRHHGIEVVVREGGRKDHLAALRWLAGQIADYRPTLLWTSLTRATLLGQIAGAWRRLPVVSWQHAAWLKPANLRLLRLTQARSRLWLADSETVARYCRDRIGIAPERIQLWPIFRADGGAAIADEAPPGAPIQIGSLGRLHPVKGYDVLLEALARLPPGLPAWELAIAGEGAERARLQAQAQALGLSSVRFPGFAPDPRAWLAGLQLYVQPSRSEGFCLAAHEAMQAGLPVIGSAVGEMARSIEDGVTGWRVPPGDPASLAVTLAQALRDPVRLARIGREARARVLDYYGAPAFRAAGLAALARMEALISG